MKLFRPSPRVLTFALLVLPMRVDDPARPKVRLDVPLPVAEGEEGDSHEEMAKIFVKIERELREIDELLSNASAGEGSISEAQKSAEEAVAGIDKLLDASEKRSRSVLQGIDRILELADHPHDASGQCNGKNGGLCKALSQSSGGAGKKGSQPGSQEKEGEGKSPLDQQGGNTTQREATPEGPEKKPGDGEKPGGDSESRSGDPRGNRASTLPPENSPATPPQTGATGEASSNASPVERWGELPPHVRDVFRAQGGGDLPAQYRDWIDAYYRRLSKRSGS